MPLPILGAIAKAAAGAAKAAKAGSAVSKAAKVASTLKSAADASAKEGSSIGVALANPASVLAGTTSDVSGAFGKSFKTDRSPSGFDDSLAPRKS